MSSRRSERRTTRVNTSHEPRRLSDRDARISVPRAVRILIALARADRSIDGYLAGSCYRPLDGIPSLLSGRYASSHGHTGNLIFIRNGPVPRPLEE